MSVGIDFVLRASTSAFTAGVASAKNSIKDFKKSVKSLELGGGIAQWIGMGGLIAGFKSAIDNARELAAESSQTGKGIDGGTAALIRFGDTLSKISAAKDAAFGWVAEKSEQLGIFFGRLVYGAEAAADAQRKLGEEAEAAAKKFNADKLIAAEQELAKFRKESRFKRASDEEKINQLLADQVVLLQKQNEVGATTAEGVKLQVEIEKNRAQIGEVNDRILKSQADSAAKVKDSAVTIKSVESARVDTAEELADAAEREAAAKAKQVEIETTLKRLNDAQYADAINFMTASRLDRQQVQTASPETLKEIARRKQANLTSLGAGGGGLSFDDNYFTRIQLQNEINQVKAELATRTTIQRNVQNLGIEGARKAFNGDPLVFDKLVQQFVQDSRTNQDLAREQVALLKRIDDRQRSGAPVVVLNQ